jgi:multidrug efflux pump subunit AcrA (membrane-fusion protein)
MLTPSEVNTIFASSDGYLEELLVGENEHVQANQVLLRMRSPALELQIEELQGQLRSLEEESHGLEISINQSKSSASDHLNEQSIIASKLSDIKIQRESISEQLNILKAQSAELEIRSPIQGVVAGRELRQNLQGRPVARGDALLKVINLESPWEIRVRVADRDSGYVSRSFGDTKNRSESSIQFVLDGLPSQTHQANVVSIANQVENIHAEGTFVTVVAKVLEPKANMRVGSNVHAYFECGSEPTWFVWTRPLIENLHRRMWL